MTYLRARRSIKVAPGFKINLNKRSVGLTVGTRGAHYSVNTRGTRTRTMGIPGTGLSIIDRQGPTRSTSRPMRPASSRPAPIATKAAPSAKHHARLLASHPERAYAKALDRLRKGRMKEAYSLLNDAISSDTKHEAVAAHLVSAIAHYKAGDFDAAIGHLEPVVSCRIDPHEDQLLHRYELPNGYDDFGVEIGQLEAAGSPFGPGPVYLLASAYAKVGRVKEAAGVMQKLVENLNPDELVAPLPLIILCELYQQLRDWDEIVHLVAHFKITNTDDATLVLRSYQAMAMANSGLTDAALEVLKDCLRSTKRNPGLLRTARYTRAQIYQKTGKKAFAKRDLSKLYADDPSDTEIERQLRELE